MGRYSRLRYILTLDPERDCVEITDLIAHYEFPFEYHFGYGFGVMFDNAIPSISELLIKTGQFRDHGQKRYDDTMIIEHEIKRLGPDSPQGRATLRALNRIHGRYTISNEDYLYVLAAQTLGPILWITAYGWRPLSDHEERALIAANRRMGTLMGIKNIPDTYQGFVDLLRTNLRERARYQETNREATYYLMQVVQTWWLKPLRPLILALTTALIDEPLRPLLGLPRKPAALTTAIRASLALRGKLIRLLPPRPNHRPYVHRARSYPNGWTLDQIGPSH